MAQEQRRQVAEGASALDAKEAQTKSLEAQLAEQSQALANQRQELAADEWGMKFVLGHYGHAGGATDFFRRLAEEEKGGELTSLFASHPFPRERIAALERMIREGNYPVGEVAPLHPTTDGVSR